MEESAQGRSYRENGYERAPYDPEIERMKDLTLLKALHVTLTLTLTLTPTLQEKLFRDEKYARETEARETELSQNEDPVAEEP